MLLTCTSPIIIGYGLVLHVSGSGHTCQRGSRPRCTRTPGLIGSQRQAVSRPPQFLGAPLLSAHAYCPVLKGFDFYRQFNLITDPGQPILHAEIRTQDARRCTKTRPWSFTDYRLSTNT